MIEILINGERAAHGAGTLTEVLQARGLDPAARGFAIAVNGAAVPRARWAETRLSEGDCVEVVRAVAGG